MSVDFDTYRERYREEVGDSIGFIGQDVDYFAEVKALHLLSLIERRLGDPRRVSVLDVGCGVGVTDDFLVPKVEVVHGVDITPGVIEEAKANNPVAVYQTYDGGRLPYEDETFDVAFAICVVHHVPPPDWDAFMAEMARVVRPGGLTVIFEHNPYNPLTRRAVNNCEFDEDAVLLTSRRAARLAVDAGLGVVERRYITFFPFGGTRLVGVERALGRVPLGAQHYVAATR